MPQGPRGAPGVGRCGPVWKRPADAEPLLGEFWPLLIAVLLAYAVPEGCGEMERGLALKSLNAALAALDLDGYRDSTEGLSQLEALAHQRLASLPDSEGEA